MRRKLWNFEALSDRSGSLVHFTTLFNFFISSIFLDNDVTVETQQLRPRQFGSLFKLYWLGWEKNQISYLILEPLATLLFTTFVMSILKSYYTQPLPHHAHKEIQTFSNVWVSSSVWVSFTDNMMKKIRIRVYSLAFFKCSMSTDLNIKHMKNAIVLNRTYSWQHINEPKVSW